MRSIGVSLNRETANMDIMELAKKFTRHEAIFDYLYENKNELSDNRRHELEQLHNARLSEDGITTEVIGELRDENLKTLMTESLQLQESLELDRALSLAKADRDLEGEDMSEDGMIEQNESGTLSDFDNVKEKATEATDEYKDIIEALKQRCQDEQKLQDAINAIRTIMLFDAEIKGADTFRLGRREGRTLYLARDLLDFLKKWDEENGTSLFLEYIAHEIWCEGVGVDSEYEHYRVIEKQREIFKENYKDAPTDKGQLREALRKFINDKNRIGILEERINKLENEISEKIGEANKEAIVVSIKSLQELYREYEKALIESGLTDNRKDMMILVPTKDRPQDLQELLMSIGAQLQLFGYGKQVRVIVVDDSVASENMSLNKFNIEAFADSCVHLNNLTIKYYSLQDQYELLSSLRSSGVDLGFFVNKDLEVLEGLDNPAESFGAKGYSGIRNMIRLIECCEVGRFSDDALIVHLDDDEELVNAIEDKDGNRFNEHVFSYFDRVSKAFIDYDKKHNRQLHMIGGNYTGYGGSILSLLSHDDTKRYNTYTSQIKPGFQVELDNDNFVGGNYIYDRRTRYVHRM